MKRKFIVLTCNPSNKETTFVWKLQTTAQVEVFGVKKSINRTYYIGGMPAAVKEGAIFEEDLSKFDIVERPFLLDETTGETIMLKWLHAKVS